jgi:hypothetical protein
VDSHIAMDTWVSLWWLCIVSSSSEGGSMLRDANETEAHSASKAPASKRHGFDMVFSP